MAGHAHICDRLDFVGIDSTGAMQQLWNVPQELLVPLPPDLPLRAAALVEPVAVAHHDVVRASLTAGEPVLVVGGGPIGVLIAVVARARGAKALLVEPDPYRRSVVRGAGPRRCSTPEQRTCPRLLEAWSEGAGAAVTFEVSGTQAGLDLAVAALGARGRLVAVGIHAEPRQVDMKRVFWKELQLLGARVYERTDFTAAVELLVQGAIPVDALVSRTAALAQAPAAFESLAPGRPGDEGPRRLPGGRSRMTTGGRQTGPSRFDLRGRLAVVTGARRGLGLAIARRSRPREPTSSGSVRPWSRPAARCRRRSRGSAGRSRATGSTSPTASRSPHSPSGWSAAGRSTSWSTTPAPSSGRPAVDHTDASWDRVIEVDLSSQFVLTREVGRQMVARGAGKVIFTASMLSFQGGVNVVGYTAAKSAIAGMTRALANEWAPHGVNVNAIAPGYFATDNTRPCGEDPERSRAILERIPAGRWGSPDDLGGAAVFLASRASDYVHGTVLAVDGGWLGR